MVHPDGGLSRDQLNEFVRETIDDLLASLSAQERLKGLPAEERLKGLSAKEIIPALPPETLEALAQLLAKRIVGELAPAELERLQLLQASLAEELPNRIQREQMRQEAREEATLSGDFRRAIYASELALAAIASQAGLEQVVVDEFLTGERTLRSDVLDRLAAVLGFRFQPVS
jgi:hypothetical protein